LIPAEQLQAVKQKPSISRRFLTHPHYCEQLIGGGGGRGRRTSELPLTSTNYLTLLSNFASDTELYGSSIPGIVPLSIPNRCTANTVNNSAHLERAKIDSQNRNHIQESNSSQATDIIL